MDATEVFEILAREHTPMLLAYLNTGISDPSAIDDLYQETMLIAWRKLEQFDPDRSFGAWIRGIAHHLMLEHFRTTARNNRTTHEVDLSWIEERFLQIDKLGGDSFEQKLLLLRDCVQQLPTGYRETIQLRYQQDRKLNEVGRLLNLSLQTVKKRIFRAKIRLSECVQRKLDAAEGLL